MSLEVEIILHENYVEALVKGPHEMHEERDRFPLILSACKLAGLSKVLIDCRKIHGEIYTIQKMLYAKKVIDHMKAYIASGGKKLQIAYVGKKPQLSNHEPALDMAIREGMQVIVTDDINRAYEFLGVKKT